MQVIRIDIPQELIDKANAEIDWVDLSVYSLAPLQNFCPVCQAFKSYGDVVAGGQLIGVRGFAIPNSQQSYRFGSDFEDGIAKPSVLYVMACKDALDFFRANPSQYVSVVNLTGIRAALLFLSYWSRPGQWEFVKYNTLKPVVQ
ncbi:MAG TPA: hypothetical protein VK625_11120 [Flavitalea sp.]|nr:hypothetical protein [Flavitalea sp.]